MNNEMVIACAVISMVSLLMSSYLFVRYREIIETERNHSKGGNDK